ncbi:phosphatase PAP2 family protein [Rhodococcus sp. ARC_M6]|uniref:phosphatase PAP2 family protein n=1 Tax=Rhodococcus sp. ARC_M6 TaxID=2928852 RepID=UPI001FB32912|nr:phosphatase PAP2 family protein [Rhodococcus sp. ARC_M6]MCJ0902954.1 phosphatase PAP2 family protein [Rhodococcus sp. ARC_M6]
MLASVTSPHAVVTEVLTKSTTAEIAVTAILVAAALFGFGSIYRSVDIRSTVLRVVGLSIALVTLSVQVVQEGWLTRFDGPVTDWMVAHRSSGLNHVAVAVTDLGSPVATTVLGIAAGTYLSWRARSVIPGIVVVGTVGAAAVASTVLKAIVGRERPPTATQVLLETDHSFPSGHVTGTAALIGIVVLVVATQHTPTVKRLLILLAVAVTAIVALTRLYLGVHWLTDVIAGAVLATLAITIGGTVFHFLNSRWPAQRGALSSASSSPETRCCSQPEFLLPWIIHSSHCGSCYSPFPLPPSPEISADTLSAEVRARLYGRSLLSWPEPRECRTETS